MKSILLALTLAFLTADPAAAVCNRLFTDVGDRCLRFFSDAALKWTEAQSRCDVIGGHLAVVDTCDLLGEISSFIDSRDIPPTTGSYWIGASDVIDEGTFVWVTDLNKEVASGVPFWGKERGIREPSGSTSQNCVAIRAADGYHFYDEDCSSLYGVLCEQDGDVAVTTTTPVATSVIYTSAPFISTSVAGVEPAGVRAFACPNGYTSVAGGCYLALSNAIATWDAARASCSLNGGHLARLRSCDVLGNLSKVLQGTFPNSGYWVGISDQVNEGLFQYEDGVIAVLSTAFWGQTNGVPEPNGGTAENCVSLDTSDDYYFHDTDCSATLSALCEADALEYFY